MKILNHLKGLKTTNTCFCTRNIFTFYLEKNCVQFAVYILFCCFCFGSPNHAGLWKSKAFYFQGWSIPKYSSFWKNVVLTYLPKFTAICCKKIPGDRKSLVMDPHSGINMEFVKSDKSSACVKSLRTHVKFSKIFEDSGKIFWK